MQNAMGGGPKRGTTEGAPAPKADDVAVVLGRLREDTEALVLGNRIGAWLRWSLSSVMVAYLAVLLVVSVYPLKAVSCQGEHGYSTTVVEPAYFLQSDLSWSENRTIGCPSGTTQEGKDATVDAAAALPLLPWAIVPALLAILLFPVRRPRDLSALAAIEDVGAAGPLTETLRMGDGVVRCAGAVALTRLLPQIRPEHAEAITSRQRATLCRALNLRTAEAEFDLQMAILQALAHIGDSEAAASVRALVWLNPRNNAQERLQTEARRTLAHIESRYGVDRHRERLLRPTGEPKEMLVRPSQAPHEVLVRPAEAVVAEAAEVAAG